MDSYTVIIVGLAISAIQETNVSMETMGSLRSPTGLEAAPCLNGTARLSYAPYYHAT